MPSRCLTPPDYSSNHHNRFLGNANRIETHSETFNPSTPSLFIIRLFESIGRQTKSDETTAKSELLNPPLDARDEQSR
jgi:hypothetical protein